MVGWRPPRTAGRPGSVTSIALVFQRLRERLAARGALVALLERRLERVLRLVGGLPGRRALVGRQGSPSARARLGQRLRAARGTRRATVRARPARWPPSSSRQRLLRSGVDPVLASHPSPVLLRARRWTVPQSACSVSIRGLQRIRRLTLLPLSPRTGEGAEWGRVLHLPYKAGRALTPRHSEYGSHKKRLRRGSTKALRCPSHEPSVYLAALRPWGWLRRLRPRSPGCPGPEPPGW